MSILICATAALAGDAIPKAAWKRPIGLPLENAGGVKPQLKGGMIDDGYWQGAPVGGFGAGTFSRTYRGDFSRWHIKGGVHKYQTVWANQFAMYQKSEGASEGVAQVLTATHPAGNELSSWKWDYPVGAGDYYSLYPKSWYEYKWEKFPAHVTLEQFSPILPDNYKESSYPVAVYRWQAENPTEKPVTVSVMLSWQNMLGAFRTFGSTFAGGQAAGNFNKFIAEPSAGGAIKGIAFDREHPKGIANEWDGQWVIATQEAAGTEVSYQTTWADGSKGPDTSEALWQSFAMDGSLPNSDRTWISSGEQLNGAIAIKFTLKPGEKRTVPMVIAWDMPVVQFGSGRAWYRHYTEFFNTQGNNAWRIAREGLLNATKWSDAIDSWQAKYVNDDSKPLWYRGMLFNEMYILADGGSFWGHEVGEAVKTPDTFTFMECYDYPFYGTLDVRFYGSMPLTKFWPELDKQELRQFAYTVPREWPDKQVWQWKTQQTGVLNYKIRKIKGAVPHDLGVPQEDPFIQPNQFNWQNTSDWKDLNSKFVLMVYRDYVFGGKKDIAFLTATWPAVQEAMEHLNKYDRNGDGIPENDGFPDQTYDVWVVRGESAYTGGLWLAALRAAEEIGKALNDGKAVASYHDLFAKAQSSYIKKLWNGQYFSYDTLSEYKDNVQADQLAGQWYADMTGLGDLVPREMRQKALKKIYDYNVMKFAKGEMGAVNGMGADGSIIKTNEQVQEVWTGTTFAVAALMLGEGMKDEAYRTAWGIYHTTYETQGYWFRTPEAWDIDGHYRAGMYMRPAAVWAMEMTVPPQK